MISSWFSSVWRFDPMIYFSGFSGSSASFTREISQRTNKCERFIHQLFLTLFPE